MNKQVGYFIVLINILLFNYSFSQESLKSDSFKTVSQIFLEDQALPVKLSYSIKDVKKNTNDTTYIKSNLSYQSKNGSWLNLKISLRARGNYRLKNCYFPPVKVKLKKKDTKKTPFNGNKNLKLVLPCLNKKNSNDDVLKEHLAYKLFEAISPYHFKTRLLDVSFEELNGKKTKEHALKGFFIEDDKTVARRFDGNAYKRSSHPLNYDAVASVRNAFFQYMIGNTDFSQAYNHNMKAIYAEKKLIPLPYDFDMAGFVNTSYAVVSQIPGESVTLTSVTQRKYRGFVREEKVFNQVRNEMISLKAEMILILNKHAIYFENPKNFTVARDYILSFFDILANNEKFKKEIIDQARKG